MSKPEISRYIPSVSYFSLAFIFGIFLSSNSQRLDHGVLTFTAIGLLVVAWLWRDRVVKIIALIFLFLILGILRQQAFLINSSSDEPYIFDYNEQGRVEFLGTVNTSPVLKGKKQQIEVASIKLLSDNTPLKGKILIFTPRYPQFHYGDILKISGELTSPGEFEEFSYKHYLESKGIYSLSNFPDITKIGEGGKGFLKGFSRFRSNFEKVADRIFPEPEASLLVGTLVGIEREMPKNFYEALKRSGTLHVIVVSGFNITIVVLFFMTVLSFLGRQKALILSFFGIALYVLLVGFNPPVLRAALMGYITLIGKLLGRQREALLSLLLSAALILFFSPLSLHSLSFQLSFLATLGILLLERPLANALKFMPKIIRGAFTTTLSAMTFVMPVLISNFGTFSVVAPLANILIFWTIPPIMALGGMAISAGMLSLNLGRALGSFAFIPLLYFVKTVEVLGNIPFAVISVPKGSWVVWLVYYALLSLFIVRGGIKGRHEKSISFFLKKIY